MPSDATSTEKVILASERISPRTPSPSDKEPRSKVYSAEKLANDYSLFMEEQEGYDPDKPLPEKQRDLFKLYEKGEVNDPIQAWEWMLGRKWDEFDAEERKLVLDNLKPEERSEYGHLLDKSIKFNPYKSDLHVWDPSKDK